MTMRNTSAKNFGLDLAETLTDGMWSYYIPILIIVGSIGNCLSIYIPLRSSMSRSSASYYMVALALSDEGFLIYIAIDWLRTEFFQMLSVYPYFCVVMVYLPMFCNFLSAWVVVAFTVERFVAVRYPLHRQSICTVARAKLILIGITFIGLVTCSPMLWIMHADCTIGFGSERLRAIFFFRVFNSVVTVILPFTIISVMNILIIKSLKWHQRIRNSLRNNKKNHNDPGKPQEHPSVSASHRKTTKMLLIVSSVFLCLNLPYNVTILHIMSQAENISYWSNNRVRAFSTLQTVSNVLLATSFGINFFLYCASGYEFRQAIFHMMICCPRSWSFPKMYSYLRRIKIDTAKKSATSSTVSSFSKPDTNCEMLSMN